MEQELKIIEENFPLFTNGKRSKRKIRHNIFSNICTNLQAYLLGFIASDGCVNELRHALILQISKNDEKILNLFKIISPNAKISYRASTNFKGVRNNQQVITDHGSVRFVIHSKTLYNDLVNLGITERKTYKQLSIPKQIPEQFISSFILGYLDGDGYITNWVKNTDNRWYTVSCKAGICSKTNNLLQEFQQIFDKNKIKANLSKDSRDQMYYLNICSKKSLRNLYNFLYQTSLGLDRKRTKLYDFLFRKEQLKQELINKKFSSKQL